MGNGLAEWLAVRIIGLANCKCAAFSCSFFFALSLSLSLSALSCFSSILLILSFPFPILLSLWLSLFPFFLFPFSFPSSSPPLAFRIYLLFSWSLPRILFLPGWCLFFCQAVFVQCVLQICLISRFTCVPWSSSVCCHLSFPYLNFFYHTFDFLSSSFLVFLICISFSFLSFFSLFFYFLLVCSPFIFPSSCHFVLPFPFSLHISLFPQSSPSACYPHPERNWKSSNYKLNSKKKKHLSDSHLRELKFFRHCRQGISFFYSLRDPQYL